MHSTVPLLILILSVTLVTPQRPNRYQYYHQYPQQVYNQYYNNPYYSNPFGRQHVVHDVVADSVWGGPTSLGWAQVPRYASPQFSPVYGG
ncbi:hypothetical protein GCK72_007155 [Caenorhabditis remanei]|uniref:Uncharacterized protein n=1 Tax=Caenorhabditis remanei TaxID=31234 RepID=A0A6A5HKI3_CAERE|nr:hypothetical protein GCK72_007155 [Caenorhabditis remanei]KAF1767196.1 hypothetical protein GCK72_007155 [Caenorhabditis remanei]